MMSSETRCGAAVLPKHSLSFTAVIHAFRLSSFGWNTLTLKDLERFLWRLTLLYLFNFSILFEQSVSGVTLYLIQESLRFHCGSFKHPSFAFALWKYGSMWIWKEKKNSTKYKGNVLPAFFVKLKQNIRKFVPCRKLRPLLWIPLPWEQLSLCISLTDYIDLSKNIQSKQTEGHKKGHATIFFSHKNEDRVIYKAFVIHKHSHLVGQKK